MESVNQGTQTPSSTSATRLVSVSEEARGVQIASPGASPASANLAESPPSGSSRSLVTRAAVLETTDTEGTQEPENCTLLPLLIPGSPLAKAFLEATFLGVADDADPNSKARPFSIILVNKQCKELFFKKSDYPFLVCRYYFSKYEVAGYQSFVVKLIYGYAERKNAVQNWGRFAREVVGVLENDQQAFVTYIQHGLPSVSLLGKTMDDIFSKCKELDAKSFKVVGKPLVFGCMQRLLNEPQEASNSGRPLPDPDLVRDIGYVLEKFLVLEHFDSDALEQIWEFLMIALSSNRDTPYGLACCHAWIGMLTAIIENSNASDDLHLQAVAEFTKLIKQTEESSVIDHAAIGLMASKRKTIEHRNFLLRHLIGVFQQELDHDLARLLGRGLRNFFKIEIESTELFENALNMVSQLLLFSFEIEISNICAEAIGYLFRNNHTPEDILRKGLQVLMNILGQIQNHKKPNGYSVELSLSYLFKNANASRAFLIDEGLDAALRQCLGRNYTDKHRGWRGESNPLLVNAFVSLFFHENATEDELLEGITYLEKQCRFHYFEHVVRFEEKIVYSLILQELFKHPNTTEAVLEKGLDILKVISIRPIPNEEEIYEAFAETYFACIKNKKFSYPIFQKMLGQLNSRMEIFRTIYARYDHKADGDKSGYPAIRTLCTLLATPVATEEGYIEIVRSLTSDKGHSGC